MCTNCFADIPGEEAVTDVGAPPRVAAPSMARRLVPVAVVGLVCGVALGTAWLQTRAPEPVVELEPVPDVVIAFEEAEPEPEVVEDVVEEQVEVPEVATAAAVPTFSSGTRQKAEPEPEAPKDVFSLDLGGMGSAVSRQRAAPLSSDAEVIRMVGTMLRRYERADVRRCYETRLKGGAEIEGTWTVRFTIQPDGSTTGARVRAANAPDGELEGCLRRAVQEWRFSPIASPFEVDKSFALRPWE